MTTQLYLLDDDTVTYATAGKKLLQNCTGKTAANMPEKVYLARVIAGRSNHWLPSLYASYKSLDTSLNLNLEPGSRYLICECIYVKPPAVESVAPFGMFTFEKTSSVDCCTVWENIVLVRDVEDIPAGMKLDCAQLSGSELTLYRENGIMVAKVKLTLSA